MVQALASHSIICSSDRLHDVFALIFKNKSQKHSNDGSKIEAKGSNWASFMLPEERKEKTSLASTSISRTHWQTLKGKETETDNQIGQCLIHVSPNEDLGESVACSFWLRVSMASSDVKGRING